MIINATVAPANCARMDIGAKMISIPLNVPVKLRAIVTAGFAKEVYALNQQAALM